MAIVIVLIGCIAGFAGGLFGWLFLDLSLVLAVLIWALSGPVAAVAMLLRALPSPVEPLAEAEAQTA